MSHCYANCEWQKEVNCAWAVFIIFSKPGKGSPNTNKCKFALIILILFTAWKEVYWSQWVDSRAHSDPLAATGSLPALLDTSVGVAGWTAGERGSGVVEGEAGLLRACQKTSGEENVNREVWMKCSRGAWEQHLSEGTCARLAPGSSPGSRRAGGWVACRQSMLPLGWRCIFVLILNPVGSLPQRKGAVAE